MQIQEPIIIDVDIKKPSYINQPNVTQNDSNTFIVNVLDNGQPLNLADVTTVTISHTRFDKKTITTGGTVVAGTNQVKFIVDRPETSLTGRVDAVVQLHNADSRISTLAFTYKVNADPTNNYTPTNSEKTLIEVVLNDGPLRIQEAIDATTAANAAAANANAEAANLSQLKTDVTTATTNANTATTNANTATTNADTATTNANNAATYASTQGDYAKTEADRLVGMDVSQLDLKVGDLTQLSTTNKTNVISAINENVSQLADTVTLNKTVREGQFPKPFRVPTIATIDSFPKNEAPYQVMYDDGQTMYAFGSDRTFRKSIDGGLTWENKSYLANSFSITSCFLKTKQGTLLLIDGGLNISRSVDDGVTWANTFKLRTGAVPLGSQSWAIDDVTGYIYFGEYNTQILDVLNLYRSKDEGVTWEVFKSFPRSGEGNIYHFHAVQWDHIAQRIVVCTGDVTPSTGLWRVNAESTDLEPIVTNGMLSADLIDAPRAIGIIPFENYLVWASDSSANPYIFRMSRTEIGKPNPQIERVYELNSTAWFTCRASDDGKTWIVCASNEFDSAIDNLVHIYAVTDEGLSVWECGSISPNSPGLVGSLMPLSSPGLHGDKFSLVTRNFDRRYTWKFELGFGFSNIERPAPILPYRFTQTLNTTGEVTLPPSGELVLGHVRMGSLLRTLYILDAAILLTDSGGVSSGYQRLIVRKRFTTESIFEYKEQSERYTKRLDGGLEINKSTLAAGDVVEIVLKNTHTTATTKATANITFACGG